MVFVEMFVHKYAARLQQVEVSIANNIALYHPLCVPTTERTACYPTSSVIQSGLMLLLGSEFVRLHNNHLSHLTALAYAGAFHP